LNKQETETLDFRLTLSVVRAVRGT